MTVIIRNDNRSQARRVFNHVVKTWLLAQWSSPDRAFDMAFNVDILATDDHRLQNLTSYAVIIQTNYFTIDTILDGLTMDMRKRAVVEVPQPNDGVGYVKAENYANAIRKHMPPRLRFDA